MITARQSMSKIRNIPNKLLLLMILFIIAIQLWSIVRYDDVYDHLVMPVQIQLQTHSNQICVEWIEDSDKWWTHLPQWHISKENDSHSCFMQIQNTEKAKLFQALYDNGYNGDCSNVITKHMWSSGWYADINNVIDGLMYGLEQQRPFQIYTKNSWHYAGKKDGSQPTCPQKDMFCYFLQFSNCASNSNKMEADGYLSLTSSDPETAIVQKWIGEYATRPQQWLRKEVYDYTKLIKDDFQMRHLEDKSCTVIHVRRADVIQHDGQSRKYHAIKEYLDAANISNETDADNQNIFLITDDQNAIDEAEYLYPMHNWLYLKRVRHRGNDGGWENQIPSNNPKQEVIVLLSIFELVKDLKCDRFIHSVSGFSNNLYDHMSKGTIRINIDQGKEIWSVKNKETAKISHKWPVDKKTTLLTLN